MPYVNIGQKPIASKEQCKSLYPYSYCYQSSTTGCFLVDGCEDPYMIQSSCTSKGSAFYLSDVDDNNCGVCDNNCDWIDQSSCETSNANWECVFDTPTGCYVTKECKSGYKLLDGACVACTCVKPNVDDYFYEGPSDCDIYGQYEGCIDTGVLEFDEAAYNAAVAEYEACLAECKLSDDDTSSCEFNSQTTCEGVNYKSTCVQSGECWLPSSCKGNYAQSCESPYNLTATDPFGCGSCVTDCEYVSAEACQDYYINSTCSQDDNGCYVPTTCKTDFYKTVSACGSSGSTGWELINQDAFDCGACNPLDCPTGTDSSWNSNAVCESIKGAIGYVSQVSSYNGNSPCYSCDTCSAPADCKWSSSNAGDASLSDVCCNNNYKTCSSNCSAVEVPLNAHSTSSCSACGNDPVPTAWECDNGYTKNNAGTECVEQETVTCTWTTASACTSANVWASACATDSNGCYQPSQCKTTGGYIAGGTHPAYVFTQVGKTMTNMPCMKITGCNSTHTSNTNSAVFTLNTTPPSGTMTCPYATSCNTTNGWSSSKPDCSASQTLNTQVSGYVTCYKCDGGSSSGGDSGGSSCPTTDVVDCYKDTSCPVPTGAEYDGVNAGTCTLTTSCTGTKTCKLKSCNVRSYADIDALDSSNPASGTNYDVCGWKVAPYSWSSGQASVTTWSLSEQWITHCCTSDACKWTSVQIPPYITNLKHYVDSDCAVIESGGDYYVYLK